MKQRQQVAALFSIALIVAFVASLIVQSITLAGADLATGRISGIVWRDSNDNGIRESNEPPLADYPVYLQRTGEEVVGAMVAVTHSDADGTFVFDNLEEGQYRIFPEDGAYVLVDVEGVNASATIELPVPPLQTHQLFLPMTVR